MLILGAGVFQLAAIQRAAELGYRVITLDYLPGNIGHRASHESVDCSTTDRDGVLEHARRLGIDGVFSMATDVALATLAHVAESLGLPGPPSDVVRVLCDKGRFRAFQQAAGLDHPRWTTARSFDRIASDAGSLADTVIVKPVDTSGSRGVTRVALADGDALRTAFDHARPFSLSGLVCVEEYVDGEDVSADGLVIDGEIVLAHFTQKFTRGFSVTGHRVPGTISDRHQQLARATLADHLRAVGYRNGPFDADLRIAEERIVVLEITPRLGGNGVPLIVSHYTGVDLVELSLRMAMGERVRPPEPSGDGRGCGSVLIVSGRSGRLRSIANASELERVPGVVRTVLGVAPGDSVSAFRHGGDVLGYAIVECRSQGEYEERAAQLYAALKMRVDQDV